MSPRREALSAYAEKATRTPAEMTAGDLAPLRAEGLTDRDLLDLTQVIGFFNSINRIADCLGVDSEPLRHDAVSIAKVYVDLSNRHDVDRIGSLLTDDAVYRSERVGRFEGREAILEMMRGFFEGYPEVRWDVDEVVTQPDGSARFAYVISGSGLTGGGEETIRISPEGRITEIEVGAAG